MKRATTVIFALLALAQRSPAPMYEGYSNIDDLIERADVIAVVELIHKEAEGSTLSGTPDQFQAIIWRTLKGDAPLKTPVTIYLRHLDSSAEFREWHTTPTTYLLFLHKQNTPEPAYGNLNIERSHWELSRHTDASKVEGMDTRKAIAYLLKDAVMNRNMDAKRFQESAYQVISELEASSTTKPYLSDNENEPNKGVQAIGDKSPQPDP